MATTYDKASLVMIPSGYKDDKLYSVKPTDGSGDFTFSRDGAGASPATRVNASGLIEKGRENILLQSNSFTTLPWINSLTTSTSGQSGYDGSSDAWLLENTASFGNLSQDYVVTGVQTFSVYAKAGNVDWMWIRIDTSGTQQGQYFDLANGVLGATGTNIAANIESVGSGWYRCSVTYNATSVRARIYPAAADNGAGQSSGTIYIQDAQLEQGLVATDYIETTTAPVSAGLLGDMPRLDYSGGATCPSLLLEPSRVNLIDYSEYFNASVWNKTRATISDNVAISPEGVQNAAKIVSTAVNDSHYIRRDVSSTTGVCYVFAKADDFTFLKLATNAHSFSPTFFNLVTGEITKSVLYDADIEQLENGWWKCIIKPTDAFTQFFVENAGDSASASHLGDGVKGVFIYGAQVESGSYPTSYIPTYGSASTRAADDATKGTATSLIGQSEGTIFVEKFFDGSYDANGSIPLSIDGPSAYKVYIWFQTNGKLLVDAYNGAVSTISTSLGYLQDNTNYKVAVSYTASTMVMYVNGTLIGSVSNPALPPSFDTIRLQYITGDYKMNKTKQILLFKEALTNAELAALTA